MAFLLHLRFPRPAEYMERELTRLRRRLPEGTAPVFQTPRSCGLLIDWQSPLSNLHRMIDRELEAFEDWDLLELGRASMSKQNAGIVASWMGWKVRFISGDDGPEPDWDKLAEEYRTT